MQDYWIDVHVRVRVTDFNEAQETEGRIQSVIEGMEALPISLVMEVITKEPVLRPCMSCDGTGIFLGRTPCSECGKERE